MASTTLISHSLIRNITRFAAKSSSSSSSLLSNRNKVALFDSFLQQKNRFRYFSITSSMASSSDFKESPSKNPGLQAIPDEATKGYIMQQTVPIFSFSLFDLIHISKPLIIVQKLFDF